MASRSLSIWLKQQRTMVARRELCSDGALPENYFLYAKKKDSRRRPHGFFTLNETRCCGQQPVSSSSNLRSSCCMSPPHPSRKNFAWHLLSFFKPPANFNASALRIGPSTTEVEGCSRPAPRIAKRTAASLQRRSPRKNKERTTHHHEANCVVAVVVGGGCERGPPVGAGARDGVAAARA